MSSASNRVSPSVHVLGGVIASAGFASGDRLVVGHWWQSPVGAFTDVMWAEPDGTRVLYVPDDTVARFVTALYRFERIEVVPFETRGGGRHLVVAFGDRYVELRSGWGFPIPFRRPRWFTRWVEGPVARAVLGVRTYGTTPSGVHEWYQADVWRPLRFGVARIGDRGLGPFGRVEPAVGFGFSEPTKRSSMVNLHTYLADPSGRLDTLCRSPRESLA